MSQQPFLRRFGHLFLITGLLFVACKDIVSSGVLKDLNTGMVTHWTGANPEKMVLMMNGEELGHNDIPLGENFRLIAKNVKGLEKKNGKILVGCSLDITDEAGKTLLHENDLFANGGQFDAVDEQFLSCTIYTGAPMEWEEHYNVAVKFWDKQGKGTIESKLKIRMIDIP